MNLAAELSLSYRPVLVSQCKNDRVGGSPGVRGRVPGVKGREAGGSKAGTGEHKCCFLLPMLIKTAFLGIE